MFWAGENQDVPDAPNFDEATAQFIDQNPGPMSARTLLAAARALKLATRAVD